MQSARKNNPPWKKMRAFRSIYLMMLPVAVYFLVFSYYPMILGIINSFHEIRLLGTSVFVGLAQYARILESPVYLGALRNTLAVGAGTFLLQFAWGLLLALGLGELRRRWTRSLIQTVSYVPYLLSWSVVGSLWITILSPTGMINGLRTLLGAERPVVFMAERSLAQGIMIFTGAWKGAGYTAALFLAAIISIDPALYEAAAMDGATRLQQLRRITLPALIPTMKVVTVLGTMGILRNFDQIFVMHNASILDQVRNLLFLIYQDGIVQFKVGQASAAACMVLLATFLISTLVRRIIRYDTGEGEEGMA